MGHRVEGISQVRRCAVTRRLVVAIMLLVSDASAQVTFTVNSTVDAVDASPNGVCETAAGNGVCTLRAAIQEANFAAGADTIMLPAGTYSLAISGRDEDQAATGDLDILDDLTLIGAGAATTIIDGAQVDRVFDNPTASVNISNVTIRNGNPGSGATQGGGIRNFGTLVLTDVTLSGNKVGSGGGGLYNAVTATLTGVTVSGNMAALLGGGILNEGDLALLNVTVSGNVAGTAGGGIQSVSGATLTNVTLTNSTGGGFDNAGVATAKSTIFADNPSSQNCTCTPPTSTGSNLDSGNTCAFTASGDLHDTDPLLGPLQDNGGPTFTQALMPGSPAIDAGSVDCPPPGTDQRGVSRPEPVGGRCDMGAFELAPTTTSSTVAGTSTTTTTMPAGCVATATLPSITCRLGELAADVQASVVAGPVHDALANLLTKATARATQADQAMTEGNAKREKKALAKAAKALKKFSGRLGTRKAHKVVPPDVVTRLQTASGQVRTDILTLRGML